jgi:hypothetical protein
VKQDRTHYECDRCHGVVVVATGTEPTTTWANLHVVELGRSAVPGERDVLLCSVCTVTLNEWLKNSPPHTTPGEAPKCNDHARWSTCPVHGRCVCATEMAAPYDPACPLHGAGTGYRS